MIYEKKCVYLQLDYDCLFEVKMLMLNIFRWLICFVPMQ